MKKTNFKTKVFLIFLSISTLLNLFFVGYYQNFLFTTLNIISIIAYVLSLILLTKQKSSAWLIAMIPSVWRLLDPTKIQGFSISKGLFFQLTNSLMNTPQEISSIFLNMLIPLIIIIYCIINLTTKTENKKSDMWIGIIFLILTSLGFIDFFNLLSYKGITLNFLFNYPSTYFSLVYILIAIIWKIKSKK